MPVDCSWCSAWVNASLVAELRAEIAALRDHSMNGAGMKHKMKMSNVIAAAKRRSLSSGTGS